MTSPEEMEPYLEEMPCNYDYLLMDPVNHFYFLIPVDKGMLTMAKDSCLKSTSLL
jgi:hypothetical protein